MVLSGLSAIRVAGKDEERKARGVSAMVSDETRFNLRGGPDFTATAVFPDAMSMGTSLAIPPVQGSSGSGFRPANSCGKLCDVIGEIRRIMVSS